VNDIETVARRMERLRQFSPINGDRSNYMLSKAEQVLIDEFPECLATIVDERRIMQAERDAMYERMRHEDQERRESAVEAPRSDAQPTDGSLEVRR
jgi:hypothetical protein